MSAASGIPSPSLSRLRERSDACVRWVRARAVLVMLLGLFATFALGNSAKAQSNDCFPTCVMFVFGTISTNTSAGLSALPTPVLGDSVSMVTTDANHTIVGSVPVTDVTNVSGSYSFASTGDPTNGYALPLPANGTVVTLWLVHSCVNYQLLCNGADCGSGTAGVTNLSFAFEAADIFSAPKQEFDAIVGPPFSTNTSCGTGGGGTGGGTGGTGGTGGSGSGSGACPASLPNCKLSGDGQGFDEADIAAMRKCLTMANPPSACDVNGDGKVTASDLIDLLRAYAQYQQQQIISRGTISFSAVSGANSGTSTGVGQ